MILSGAGYGAAAGIARTESCFLLRCWGDGGWVLGFPVGVLFRGFGVWELVDDDEPGRGWVRFDDDVLGGGGDGHDDRRGDFHALGADGACGVGDGA